MVKPESASLTRANTLAVSFCEVCNDCHIRPRVERQLPLVPKIYELPLNPAKRGPSSQDQVIPLFSQTLSFHDNTQDPWC
jgi:hypothetical protein